MSALPSIFLDFWIMSSECPLEFLTIILLFGILSYFLEDRVDLIAGPWKTIGYDEVINTYRSFLSRASINYASILPKVIRNPLNVLKIHAKAQEWRSDHHLLVSIYFSQRLKDLPYFAKFKFAF